MKNTFGWMTAGLAFVLNLNSINGVLAIVISVGSILFIGFKIYGQILDNRIKKKQLSEELKP